MKNKVHLIIGTIICAALVFLFLAFNEKLPDNVPVQIGVDGDVSNVIPKPLLIYGIPVIFIIVNLYRVVPLVKKNEKNIIKYYTVPIISIIISAAVILFSLSF